jgi:xanthine/CO dehydrogenase XdhC/CoxF family maturation factor
LPIGSRSAPEIAIAILAEVMALRSGICLSSDIADNDSVAAGDSSCRSVPRR